MDLRERTEHAEMEIDYLYECEEKLRLLQTEYRSLVNIKAEADTRLGVLETQKSILTKTVSIT